MIRDLPKELEYQLNRPFLTSMGMDISLSEYKEIIMDEQSFDADAITPHNWEGFRDVRKKPIVVQACQMNLPEGFQVTTPEGVVKGKQGDYLMIGVAGEKYPCRKDIFEQTYDFVDAAPSD